jgi:hypothetical protein
MAKYKELVTFDRNTYFWIVVDNGKFIRYPTEEDLKDARERSYSRTNVCDMCWDDREKENKELTNESILYPGNARHIIGENGKKTNRYGCERCSNRYRQRYDLCSSNNIIKSMADRRMGNLKDSNHIFADNCQELTHRWTGAEDLNKKNDNYTSRYDHGPINKRFIIEIEGKQVDLSGKILQTTGRRYDSRNGYWAAGSLNREWTKDFDYLVFYCADKHGQIIERIYFIPKKEIFDEEIKIGRIGIGIFKNPMNTRGTQPTIPWYEKYRVVDKEAIVKVNEIWKQILKIRAGIGK